MTASERSPADPIDASLPRVFLHIGTMKTGTSFLQQVLSRNTRVLERDGVLYANKGRTASAIHDALRAPSPEQFADWRQFVRAAQAHTGRSVIVSSEMLSFADDDRARWIIESFAPNPVTVIVTARDLARLLPSAWQNKVKHGRGWPFDAYVNSVMEGTGDPKGAARSFWHHHDLATIVRRWANAVGPDQLVVIPVPGRDAGPTALWDRFATVTGLGDGYDTAQDRGSNLSLGYAETELLRLVNRELRTKFDRASQQRVVQRLLANEVLRPDPSKEPSADRPRLTPDQHEWAIHRSQAFADDIAAMRVQVVGDLTDLVPAPIPDDQRDEVSEAAPPAIPDMFVQVVVALVSRLIETAPSPPGDRGSRPRERRAGAAGHERPGRRGERRQLRGQGGGAGGSAESADDDLDLDDLDEALQDELETDDAELGGTTQPRRQPRRQAR